MNRVAQFKKIQTDALKLFTQKNKDYGDAFATYGTIGVLIRMKDKIDRALSITNNGITLVPTESLRDTLVDLHNYAGMAVMLLDEKTVIPLSSSSLLPPPPHPRNGRCPPPPLGGIYPLPSPPPPPSPSKFRKRLKRCDKYDPKYNIGQTVEIYSNHIKPAKVYKAIVITNRSGRKIKLELDDGHILYLNAWALKLKQSRAKRFLQDQKNPLEKKWYLN